MPDQVSHRGKKFKHRESMWTFTCRDWRVVAEEAHDA